MQALSQLSYNPKFRTQQMVLAAVNDFIDKLKLCGTTGKFYVGVGASGADANGCKAVDTTPEGTLVPNTTGTCPTGWSGYAPATNRFIFGAGGAYAVDDRGGATTVRLDDSNLPPHRHTFSGSDSITYDKPVFLPVGDGGNDRLWVFSSWTTDTATVTISGNTGTGTGLTDTPFGIMPPYLALKYCVKN